MCICGMDQRVSSVTGCYVGGPELLGNSRTPEILTFFKVFVHRLRVSTAVDFTRRRVTRVESPLGGVQVPLGTRLVRARRTRQHICSNMLTT